MKERRVVAKKSLRKLLGRVLQLKKPLLLKRPLAGSLLMPKKATKKKKKKVKRLKKVLLSVNNLQKVLLSKADLCPLLTRLPRRNKRIRESFAEIPNCFAVFQE